jgi:hypothetical protein
LRVALVNFGIDEDTSSGRAHPGHLQPQIRSRESGRVLVLPPHAGHGAVEEPLENVM